MSLKTAVEVRERIRSCTSCDLHLTCHGPVPWSGATPAKIAVLGQAPGHREDIEGKPFVGPAGWHMRLSLRKARINPALVAFLNPVNCYPGRLKNADKEPSRAELAACRTNLLDQIDVIQPSYLILAGKIALAAFRPDLSLAHVHGKPLFYNGREARIADSPPRSVDWNPRHIVLWPTYHPAAALRQVRYEILLNEDLAAFWDHRATGQWHDVCVVCQSEEIEFDAWGVARCLTHRGSQSELFPIS